MAVKPRNLKSAMQMFAQTNTPTANSAAAPQISADGKMKYQDWLKLSSKPGLTKAQADTLANVDPRDLEGRPEWWNESLQEFGTDEHVPVGSLLFRLRHTSNPGKNGDPELHTPLNNLIMGVSEGKSEKDMPDRDKFNQTFRYTQSRQEDRVQATNLRRNRRNTIAAIAAVFGGAMAAGAASGGTAASTTAGTTTAGSTGATTVGLGTQAPITGTAYGSTAGVTGTQAGSAASGLASVNSAGSGATQTTNTANMTRQRPTDTSGGNSFWDTVKTKGAEYFSGGKGSGESGSIDFWSGVVGTAADYYNNKQSQKANQAALDQLGEARKPYIDAGNSALERYQQLLGLKPGANPEDIIKSTPGYQFQLDQGTKAAERRASAQGTLNSGNILAELQTIGQGQALQASNNYMQQLAGVTDAGQGYKMQQAGDQASNTVLRQKGNEEFLEKLAGTMSTYRN